jgi:two-component system OmpR family response regulator
MRVLLVEDDADTRAMVQAMLKRIGHVAETAANGEDGLWMATEFDFDVVILDWDMPGPDGIEVCQALRARERWMPILMLTGNSAVEKKVIGLNAGADDYLTKPFAPQELEARLNALGRRVPQERPTVLVNGDLVFDPAARQCRRGDTVISLRPKEFALLELFMRRPGEVLSRGEILDRAWDMAYDGMSNVVDVQVRLLRQKIDKPFGRDTIETVPRVGYRLRAESAVPAATAS